MCIENTANIDDMKFKYLCKIEKGVHLPQGSGKGIK